MGASAFHQDHSCDDAILPPWAKLRRQLTNSFPAYYANPNDTFHSEVNQALRLLDALKQDRPDGPVFLGKVSDFPERTAMTAATLSENGAPISDVISRLVSLFNGMNNTAHPNFQFNVIPHPNKAAIIAALLANCTSQNYIAGHSAWNTARAEIESVAMIAGLIDGWDPAQSGGIFTYGGAGCYMYGIKYALNSVMKSHDVRARGAPANAKLLCSQQGHYASRIAADWLGIGTDNVIYVATEGPDNRMDMADLEAHLQACERDCVPVLAVVCTMGTTDAMAMDPVDKVAALVSKYPNPSGFNRPLIYCDSVSCWAFLSFCGYDFVSNPLGFSQDVRDSLDQTYEEMKKLQHADAIAIDFHKTGWAPYTTSLFMVRDFARFESTMSRTKSAYIHNVTPYNPGLYSLEVSRSGAPALGAWATLNYFGLKGLRVMIGGVVEMCHFLRSRIDDEVSMTWCNKGGCGLVTLFRIYPAGVDADEQYIRELTDSSSESRAELEKHNELQRKVAEKMWQWARSGKEVDGRQVPCCNYTSGFRTTDYGDGDSTMEKKIYALKSFPMSVNVTMETMDTLIHYVKLALEHVTSG